MQLNDLARAPDGRPAATERPCPLGFSDAEARWVCWRYGCRLTGYRQSRFGAELTAVLGPDPRARPRGDWIRSPVLIPGVDTPVPRIRQDPTRWSPLWTPPKWPPGYGPVRPAPERMPLPTPEQIRERHEPALLLVLGGLFALLALAVADSRPAGAVLLALFSVGGFLAHLPAGRSRDRLIERAGRKRPMYDPPPRPAPPQDESTS